MDNDNSFSITNARAGVSAHWATELTYDYYISKHGRNSFDNAGGRIISYIHYQTNYNNAFWDGTRMTFGDGDGVRLQPLVSLDIVGHEFTHGVTQFTAGLIYANESGALNESFSDIFGESIEAFKKSGDPDWLVGAQIGTLRSMNNPNSRSNPDTYLGRFWRPHTDDPNGNNDNGGVHTNSGVQNFWFYLLSEGGSGFNDNNDEYFVSGIGIEQAAQIAYRNLSAYLAPRSGYVEARLGSLRAAIDLFGENSPQAQSVSDAWFAVGVSGPSFEAAVAVSSDTLDFFAETASETDTVKLTITNAGLSALTINAIQVSGAPFQLESPVALPRQLNYNEEMTVSLIFAPLVAGEFIGSLSVSSNDPNNPVRQVILRGTSTIVTDVNEPPTDALPASYALHQNFPNPFNPTTIIRYDLPEASEVTLKIYDVMGREVRALVNAKQSAGFKSVLWDGLNEHGQRVSSGVYIYKLLAGNRTQARKMLFVK